MREETGDSAGPAQDQVRFGSSRQPRPRLARWNLPRQPLARCLAAVAVIAVIVAVAVITTHSHARGRAAGRGETPAKTPVAPWYAVGSSIAMKALHHPLLDEHSGWELLAAGNGSEPGSDGAPVLVRIQLAAGLVTRTRLPPLDSTGPDFLIAGPGQAIFRPLDFVPGYLVPDGRPARGLPAALGEGGAAFPGPRPGQLWITGGSGAQSTLRLMTMNGAAAGQSIRQLPGRGFTSVPDGQGYVLVQDGGTVYDARPAGMRRVATGTIAAVGDSAWLIGRCHSANRCVNTVIDPAIGVSRVLPGSADLVGYPVSGWPPGLISPDGRLAAVVSYGPGNRATMNLVDLRTGTDRRIALGARGRPGLAWSPGSRWLFSVTSNGALQVINPTTGQVRGIGVALPPVTYLAISRTGY